MIIEKFVCLSHRDFFHWNHARKKPVRLIFSVKKYRDGFMSYVVTEYTDKKEKKKVQGHGNSLRTLGCLGKQALLSLIDGYTGLDQVKADFFIG